MIGFYPYSSPIILTDDIFQTYGGDLSKLVLNEARQVCYQITEQVASEDLNTFLLPTIITGTYHYAPRLMLNHAYVINVRSVKFYNQYDQMYWQTSGTTYGQVAFDSHEYGILNMNAMYSLCGISSMPDHIDIAYEAGLPTGVATLPKVLMALVIYADIMMNEFVGYGNEAPGDIGIQEFYNQAYRERRIGLFRTNFGSSPRALLAHRMLNDLRIHRYSSM